MLRLCSEVLPSPANKSGRLPLLRRSCSTMPRCTRVAQPSPSVLRASPHEVLRAQSLLSRSPDELSRARMLMETAPHGLAGDAACVAAAPDFLRRLPSNLERLPSNLERSPVLPVARRR